MGGWLSKLMGGFGGAGLMGAGLGAAVGGQFGKSPFTKGLGMLGGGLLGGAAMYAGAINLGASGMVGGAISPMSAMMGNMTAFLTNPATIIAAAAIVTGLLAYKFAKGKSTEQAGAMEVTRDLGGVQLGQDTFKSFVSGFMDPKNAWGIRKDIMMSPKFLAEVAAPAAKSQGKYASFLTSLEKITTSFGTFNFREAFELGSATGDWTKLNQQFVDAFGNSKELLKVLPNFAEVLAATGEVGKTALQQLIEPWTEFRQSIADSIGTVDPMFQKFLDTGEITADLRNQIVGLGVDMGNFESVSRLTKLVSKFDEFYQILLDTGNVLPEFEKMLRDLGADMTVLQDAAKLKGLKESLSSIEGLISSIEGTLDKPLEKLMSGDFGADVIAALKKAGLDPDKLKPFAEVAGMKSNWADAVNEFFNGVKRVWDARSSKWVEKPVGLVKGGVLWKAIEQYGGAEGKLALERYGKGINTITPEFIAEIEQRMNKDYQEKAISALEYLRTAQQNTKDAITTLEGVIREKLDKVRGDIVDQLNSFKKGVLDDLDTIIVKLGGTPNTETHTPQEKANTTVEDLVGVGDGTTRITGGASGGRIAASGLAIIHKGEQLIPAGQVQKIKEMLANPLMKMFAAPMNNTFTPGLPPPGLLGDVVKKFIGDITPSIAPPRTTRQVPGGPETTIKDVVKDISMTLAAPFGTPQIVINGNIYGWDDFVEKVRQAGITLKRRGT